MYKGGDFAGRAGPDRQQNYFFRDGTELGSSGQATYGTKRDPASIYDSQTMTYNKARYYSINI